MELVSLVNNFEIDNLKKVFVSMYVHGPYVRAWTQCMYMSPMIVGSVSRKPR
jgi:hypothetical protein